MDKILGNNTEFRLEVEDNPKSVLLVLDRKCDYCVVPWQDAFRLAEVMQQVISDVLHEFKTTFDRATVYQEQAQIKLAHHKGLVGMVVEWTDRIRFTSLEALFLVSRALRQTAQDAELEMRNIHILYNKQGFISQLIAPSHTQIVR